MSAILVILAAIFNSCMDRVETVISFNDSIFSKYNPLWWSKAQSADNKYIGNNPMLGHKKIIIKIPYLSWKK